MREGLFDHFAKGQACKQLHLRADGEPDDVRLLLRHRRHDQLIAEVPIDVHLLIVQTGQHFFGYAGAIAQIAFHRIEDERRGIIGCGNVGHRFAEGVQRAFQYLGLVETLATHDQLRIFSPIGQIEHIDRIGLLHHGLLIRFLLRQRPRLLLILERLELHPQPGLHPDQELHAEEVIPHPDIDVALDDCMARLPQHGSQRGQGEIGRRRHPLRRKEQHDLAGLSSVLSSGSAEPKHSYLNQFTS